MKRFVTRLAYSVRLASAFAALFCFGGLSLPAGSAELTGLSPVVIEKVSVARQLELLRGICPQDQAVIRDGVPVCATCPAFMSGDGGGLRIINTISGSFTEGGKQEILVDVTGCEPEAAHGGGSVLLEAGEQGWSRVAYQPGLRSTECVRFRSMQQTVSLACNMSSIRHGVQHGSLVWFSLSEGKPVQEVLLQWYDNSPGNPKHLVSVFPHRLVKSDFNTDGRVDLQVSVRLRDEAVPAKYPGFVQAVAAGHRFAKPESVRLIFFFDGNSLRLAPRSADGKERIDALLEQVRDSQK